jgi:cysteine desulfurase/selenocysteine lyase
MRIALVFLPPVQGGAEEPTAHDIVEEYADLVLVKLAGIDPSDAGALLDAQGIEVRVGHHCCQPLMDSLGVTGLIRASAYLYNTEAEIDALVAGLKKITRTLGPAKANA